MTNEAAWRDLYPFESHYLTCGGARLHYVDEGAGRPLLFVHGNPTWSFYWRQLITAFRSEYRVIAVDHIGCGLSDKPQDYPYTLAQHTNNLSQLIRQLDLQETTLVAHDWGGAIGLGAAVANRAKFQSVALLNTGAFPPFYIPWRIRVCRIPWLGTWGVRKANLFARAALHMAVADRDNLSSTVRAGLLAPYDNWEHRVAIDRFVQDIPATNRHPTWQTLEQLEQDLSQIDEWAVQLIWGMQDWCFRPSCLERFQQIFPQAEALRLPNASHYVVEETPEEVIDCLANFLRHESSKQD